MSEEKKEAQKALLGELESIKSLLSEDEWDDIPVLSDPIPAPTSEHIQTDARKDSPAEDDISASPQPKRETSDIDAAVDKLNFDLDLEAEDDYEDSADNFDEDETESDDFDGMFDDVPLLEEIYIPEEEVSTKTGSTPVPEEPLTDETPLSAEEPLADTEPLDSEEPPASEESETLSDAPTTEEQSASERPLAFEEQFVNEEPVAAAEHSTTQELSTGEKPADEEPADREKLSAEEEPPVTAEETVLPPGVLPGQRSLFDNKTTPVKTPDQSVTKTATRPTVQSRGENPFLPQHIRERLHTNKALLDIIKESPVPQVTTPTRPARYTSEQTKPQENLKENLPPVLPSDKLHQMVEGIIAVYLPKIEAELRQRLLEALQNDNPKSDD